MFIDPRWPRTKVQRTPRRNFNHVRSILARKPSSVRSKMFIDPSLAQNQAPAERHVQLETLCSNGGRYSIATQLVKFITHSFLEVASNIAYRKRLARLFFH
jgi:hypothetical protein